MAAVSVPIDFDYSRGPFFNLLLNVREGWMFFLDVVVTHRGIAVNPLRKDLLKRLAGTRLPLRPIEELRDEAYGAAGGEPEGPDWETGDIVAVIEYRDGTMLDVVRRMRT